MNEALEKSTLPQQGIDKPSRLVLIVSERTISEYSIFLSRLLIGLSDESIPVVLICPPGCKVNSVWSVVEVFKYPIIDLPLIRYLNIKVLLEKLDKFNPTVLHCLCERKITFTRYLARHLNVPYVLTINSLQKRWGQLYVSSKQLTKIIVPSESIAANIAEIYPKLVSRIEQINTGSFASKKLSCFSRIGQLANIVVCISSMEPNWLENFLGALKHLMIDGYEFMLVFICEAAPERGLRKLLNAFSLSQITVVVPRLEPQRTVLAAGDIFIQPWPSDSFEPLVLEAMSVGVAVAGCKGGVDDLMTGDKRTALFDPDDELSIYNCLQHLLGAREETRRLAKAAQNYVRKNHSVSNMVSSLLGVYQNAQIADDG